MKKKTMMLLTALMLTVTAVPCRAEVTETPVLTETPVPTETPAEMPTPEVKNGLLKEGTYYRYYENGKLLKSAWKTVGGKKYYFKSNGNAATGSYKIKNVYYVFSTKGQLLTSTKTRIVTVGNAKYYVDKNGKAVKGIDVINGKFYSFKTNGLYDEMKTKKIRAAAKYTKDFTPLKKLIGNPKKTKYYSSSCYGPGQDGLLTYSNFKVYVYRYKGKVIFMGAE